MNLDELEEMWNVPDAELKETLDTVPQDDPETQEWREAVEKPRQRAEAERMQKLVGEILNDYRLQFPSQTARNIGRH